MSVQTALAILRISHETWLKIPKRDRQRILNAIKKGAIAKAREILKKTRKRKGKTRRKRRRR